MIFVNDKMDQKIHQILQEAGVEHQMNDDDLALLILLGNDDMWEKTKCEIENSTKDGKISEQEAEKLIKELEQTRREFQAKQKEEARLIEEAIATCEKDIFSQKVSRLKNPQEDLKLLEAELSLLIKV